MNKKIYGLLLFLALSVSGIMAQNTVVIQDGDLEGGQTYNWTNDNIYQLDGFVYLEEGGTLNIEAGTVIQGLETPTTGDNASALIITRGAQIFAEGTADDPIIFTAEIDDLSNPADLDATDNQLWGGLILLGRATIADNTPEVGIEGIPAGDPRALYGDANGNFQDDDNSGVLRYVSIRHGGAEIGAGNEINGLTLGAVGSGTTIEFVEVFANFDDGIEFFGGTVDVKNAVVAFAGDDSFDWDTGYRGRGQFWFVLQGETSADNGAEMDGAIPDGNLPFASPTIYNATYIGSGIGATAANEHALFFRDGTGGQYSNSIFTDYANFAIQVEDRAASVGVDSRQRLEDGDLTLSNNIWWNFGSGNELNAGANGIIQATDDAEDPDAQFLIDHLAGNANTLESPALNNISRTSNGTLDPRPTFGSPAFQNLAGYPEDDFFMPVSYKGAFGSDLWIRGWTAVDEYGYTPAMPDECIVVTDDDLQGGQAYTFTSDNCYLLDGFVYLEGGGTLTIEPGTIIKGREVPSTGDNASALIITRGAQIFAEGTEEEPIVFTAEIDDTNDPTDLGSDDNQLWGGLILLGRATIADNTPEVGIEGIPAGDPRALYGAANGNFVDTDNSGVLRYVSIRHGGAEIGAGNEINGLTLGAVGSGTTIEFVEVFANFDDGIEFFGGTVDVKNAVVAFAGDDSFDWDTGYRGKGQFWFVLQSENTADNGAEMDGAIPDGNLPFAKPTVYNATYIGSGTGATAANEHALLFRDGTGGQYSNSIFTEYANFAIQVEDRAASVGVDSRQRLEDGDLILSNNIWWNFGSGNELNAGANGIIQATDDAEDPDAQFLIDHLAGNANSLQDPQLGNVARTIGGGLDPRPGIVAYGNLADFPEGDDFYTPVSFKGAFCNDGVWINNWTAVSEYGYLADIPSVGQDCDEQAPTECILVTDNDLQGGETYNWTSDNCYLLDGFVYLEEGGTLNIEAGTVIQGREVPSTGDNASALIITRGAQIFAEGTENDPIIFTTEIDDVNDPNDLGPDDNQLWGGLILLGRATIADNTPEVGIEGIPAGDPRALYGDANGNFQDDDNSGVLRYVSIRHGGAEIGAGNEINGLTLGAVGSGTTIEFVEVFANFDDGIEFFGGTVDVKNAVVAFAGDDSFDWDTGYRGKGQFWFVLQSENTADNGAEMDGAIPDGNLPFAKPTVYNATYIGSGTGATAANEHALLFRDGTGGQYSNSIFTEYANFAIQVEDRAASVGVDSRQRLEDGDLVLSNNIWWNFGSGNELNAGPNGIIQASSDSEDPTAQFLIDHLAGNANTLQDPQLGNVARTVGGGLDPRPSNIAYGNLADFPEGDDFYTPVSFKGAFCNDGVWINNWTAVSEYGYLADIPSVGQDCDEQAPTECIVITDNDLQGGETYNWTSDNCYLLDGFVYLEEGGTLNIEAGTVIQGREVTSTGDNASALIITRGAQIFAEGTADDPIIFTAEIDDVNDPNDLGPDDNQLWGGLILLGRATIADNTPEVGIEGIPAGDPRALYGDANGNFQDDDNSGVLRYVSIRHGGAEIGAGNEINGLTLGAVGSGTTIEFVEVFANFDDGIEFFGGTVDVKNAVVAFAGDDSFDWDTGYRGKGQFWFVLQGPNTADNGAEMDGAIPDGNLPFAKPTVYNATYIGSGTGSGVTAANEHALLFRDGTGGQYSNSIFTEYANFAIQVEDRAASVGVDSRQRLEDGDLVLSNNIWWNFGSGNELNAGSNGIIQATDDAEDPDAQFLIDHLAGNANTLENPQLVGISRTTDGGLDPRPGNVAYGNLANFPEGDDFYTPVSFKGAFCNDGVWINNWTAVSEYGYLANIPSAGQDCDVQAPTECIVVTDDDLEGGQTYNWTSDNCYLLDGFVYLEGGGTLNIEAGTVIQGREITSTGDNASALIITRGAQIFAEGTADNPIIFTAEIDDVNDPNDLGPDDNQLWGGLILLGRATIADNTPEVGIEGIPAGDPRALYGAAGGNFQDDDNSGVLRYVSIRHGGAEIGAGNEINGLTLGAVGSGTTLEYIEVFANFDDGIEFFGGTAELKYAAVGFAGDDSYDWDTGYRGKGQFWFALQSENTADNGAEMDGAIPDGNLPFSQPTIYNATYIGSGIGATAANEHALFFRDGTGGQYSNSIFTEYANFAIQVEDRAASVGVDSRQRLEDGDLILSNNIWWNFGSGDELNAGANGIIQVSEDAEDVDAQFLIDHLAANGNTLEDPALNGISRAADGGLDPRPGDIAYGSLAVYPAGDDFYTPVMFKGAFCQEGVWIQGWTAISEYGYLGAAVPSAAGNCDLMTNIDVVDQNTGIVLSQTVPNPAISQTQIRFTLPTKTNISLIVSSATGKEVARIFDNDPMLAGEHTVDFNVSNLANGIYFYTLRAGEVVLTKSFVVNN